MSTRGQGRIYPRGNLYWAQYSLNGKKFRESTGTNDPKEAVKFLKHRIKEIGADQLGLRKFVTPANSRLTVRDLVAALRAQFELDGKLSPQNKCELSRVESDFGDYRATALTSEQVDTYINKRLAEGAARATVNRLLSFLARAYKLAIERKHLVDLPRITHLSENNARQGFLNAAEFEKVRAALPADLQDYALFAFNTGWRKGEISSLTWNSIHDGVIRLRGEDSKNGEARSVVIAGALVAIIERRQAARLAKGVLCSLVFHRGGMPVYEFRKAWASACKKAGFAGRLFHDLRRSAVRNMIRAGVPQFVAMATSGHKTVSMFKRYAISSEEDLRQAMESVQKYNATQSANVVSISK